MRNRLTVPVRWQICLMVRGRFRAERRKCRCGREAGHTSSINAHAGNPKVTINAHAGNPKVTTNHIHVTTNHSHDNHHSDDYDYNKGHDYRDEVPDVS